MTFNDIKYLMVILFIGLLPRDARSQDTQSNNWIGRTKEELVESNFADSNITNYRFYLVNNIDNDLDNELKFIDGLESGWQKAYLKGLIEKRQNDFEDAADYFNQALQESPDIFIFYEDYIESVKLEMELSSDNNQADLIKDKTYRTFFRALSNYSNNDFEKASDFFTKLRKQGIDNHVVNYRYAYTLRNLGNYDKAFKVLDNLIEKLNENSAFFIKSLNAQGSLFYLSGDYDKAKSRYAKALENAEKIGFTLEKTKALINLGILLDNQGRVYKAREKYKNAIELAESIGDLKSEAKSLTSLGVSYTYTNEFVKAKENYLQAKKIYEKLSNRNQLSYLHNNLGRVYQNFTNYKQALKHYETAMELAGDNKRSRILNLTGMADIYGNLSNYSKALKLYQKANKLSSEIRDVSSKADVQNGLGILYLNLGAYEKALEHFETAYNRSQKMNDAYKIGNNAHKLGLTHLYLGNLDKSEDYLINAKNTSEKSGDVYTNIYSKTDLASLFIEKEKLAKAKSILTEALKTSKNYGLSQLAGMQNLILSEAEKELKNMESAKERLDKALSYSRQADDKITLIEVNYRLAEYYNSNKKNSEAARYFGNAVSLADSISYTLAAGSKTDVYFSSQIKKVYDDYAEFLIERKNYRKAFEVIERSKSRNTLKNLVNIKLQNTLSSNDIIDRYFELRWMINSNLYGKTKMDSLRKEFSDLKSSILEKHSGLKNYLIPSESIGLEEMRSKLSNDEALISFFTNEKNTYAFILKKDEFSYKSMKIDASEIDSLISLVSPYYKKDIAEENIFFNSDLFAFNSEISNELYKILMRDVVSEIPAGSNLVMSLPSELLQIPFEFFITEYDKNSSPYSYDDKKYLIQDYQISYTPSALIFERLKKSNKENGQNILLMGDPSYQNSDLSATMRGGLLESSTRNINLYPLKYSEEEIENLSGKFGNTRSFLAQNATETNFKENAAGNKLIHLSTHTFLAGKQPIIVFSTQNDKSNDGLLERSEIAALDLNSELVVLSSCRSGLGKIDKAEGIMGMQKSFFDAGAESMIVSLWDVNDKYTAKLMELFYENLSKDEDKAKALRKAKIEFIDKYSPNPYYWAGFILSGNTSKMKLENNYNPQVYLLSSIVIILLLFSFFVFKNKQKSKKSYDK